MAVLSLGFIVWGVGDLDDDGANNIQEMQAGTSPFRAPQGERQAVGQDSLACQLGLEECVTPSAPEPQQVPAEKAIWTTSGFALVALAVAAYGGIMVRRVMLR